MTGTSEIKQVSIYGDESSNSLVRWSQWSEDTFQLAEDQDKPIFLHIGYSACHWCNQTFRELFNDVTICDYLNKHFISIKIDREIRPDIDKIYQSAHVILNGIGGGWPLTVFIEAKTALPFFVGTYFSKVENEQQISFQSLLASINNIFSNKHQDVINMTRLVNSKLKNEETFAVCPINNKPLFEDFISTFLSQSDKKWGGLIGVPKFSQVSVLRTAFILLVLEKPDNKHELYKQIMLTTQSMSKIGLFDHVAGGFFRYCVDNYWGVPHFEKMLFDNAQTVRFFCELASFNKEGVITDICRRTLDWIVLEMRSEVGLYVSSLSSESDQREAEFYLWDKQELQSLLTEEEWLIANVAFGFDQPPNVHSKWHIHQWQSEQSISEKTSLPIKQIQWHMEPIRHKLFLHREERRKPLRSENQLTDWNAQLATTFFNAGHLLNRNDYIEEANNILKNIVHLHYSENVLLHSINKDSTAIAAHLDDYVFLLEAIIQKLQSQWDEEWLSLLSNLTYSMLSKFLCSNGGLKFSQDLNLPSTTISFHDDATPSANALAYKLLSLLSILLSQDELELAAKNILSCASTLLKNNPLKYAEFVGNRCIVEHMELIILRGSELETSQWKKSLTQDFKPQRFIFSIPNSDQSSVSKNYPKRSKPFAILFSAEEQKTYFSSIGELLEALNEKRL